MFKEKTEVRVYDGKKQNGHIRRTECREIKLKVRVIRSNEEDCTKSRSKVVLDVCCLICRDGIDRWWSFNK